MTSRKSRRGRASWTSITPTPTGEGRLTNVRDPRASARFSPGDRVRWHDEEAIFISEDPRDPTIAIVRLVADGRVTEWPGALAGMRRDQTPHYDTPPDLTEVAFPPAVPPELAPLEEEEDYEEMRLSSGEDTISDLGDTLAGIRRR